LTEPVVEVAVGAGGEEAIQGLETYVSGSCGETLGDTPVRDPS